MVGEAGSEYPQLDGYGSLLASYIEALTDADVRALVISAAWHAPWTLKGWRGRLRGGEHRVRGHLVCVHLTEKAIGSLVDDAIAAMFDVRH